MSTIPDFVFDHSPPFSQDELKLLKLLLSHVQIIAHYNTSYAQNVTELRLKNVALWTDIKGATAVGIVDANPSTGVQRVFATRGSTKCMICDEFTIEGMVCENCKIAVKWARATNAPAPTKEVLDLLKKVNDAGLLDALILMNKENIKKWMEAETEEMK